eukprot:CAMPEP_0179431918 /NCGR_PEP_ID=MMETSP0799-20121207/16689_1 /TAXON_ID=46947 /ORGANISM="Geminigera cryophila, Strain CCMP2564" /LENGTH=61 /DNA_ID=CAMNT_0021209091 /DNA_START=766 /DNA_END=951 /DNA_ORIENTATION=-
MSAGAGDSTWADPHGAGGNLDGAGGNLHAAGGNLPVVVGDGNMMAIRARTSDRCWGNTGRG